MKYHSQDLLTLLISLFILSSCSNPSLVGLDIDERDQIQGQYMDTLTVHSAIFKDASVITSGSAITPLGFIKDPVIGESSASFAFALAPLSSGDSRLPANITIDSAVLVMNYGKEFFGDTLASTYHVEVNQLKEPYKFGNSYTSDHTWALEPSLIGQKTVKGFAYRDSVLIGKNVEGKDTLIRVAPQLRIPMDVSKLKGIFDSNIDSATFANGERFHALVKGFYVSINQSSQEGDGGIVQLALNNEVNGIEVYYKLPDSTSQTVRRYAMSSGQSSAAITHTYTEAIENQLASSSKDQPIVFTQGLAGLSTAIQFPYLENLKEQGLVINKAELVIHVDEEVSGTEFNYQAPRLTLYQKDIAGQVMPIPDGDTRVNANGGNMSDPRSFRMAFGGFYNKDKKLYQFALTSFIQDILQGKTKNKEIYLIPSSAQNLTNVPYMPDFRTSSRAVLGGGSNEKYKMKLNLYISKINN